MSLVLVKGEMALVVGCHCLMALVVVVVVGGTTLMVRQSSSHHQHW